jgi:hypothetical protein
LSAGLIFAQHAAQRQLWIRWNDDVARRLRGSAPLDRRMVSVRRLCAQEGKAPADVFTWATKEGHEILRVRRGNRFHFYILPLPADRQNATEVDNA